jgi:glycosyltransferase involved in cell wall biosynthesis
MIRETPRVVYHDRVGQDELAKAFLEAKVWTYPTWFTETFCITAIEAQAAGCIPVTSALAALNETVHHGFLLTGSATTAAYGAAFVARVVDLLTDDETRRAHARAAREHAMRTWGWDQLAVKWETMFRELLEEKHRELAPGPVSMPVPGTVNEVAAKDIDLR